MLNLPELHASPHAEHDSFLIDRSHREATGHYAARVNPVGALYTDLLRSGFPVFDMDRWEPAAIGCAHPCGRMVPVKAPAADAFAARKSFQQGKAIHMPDAVEFSPVGFGHYFARPWKAARAGYETILAIRRDVLRIAPADRRLYGIL